MGEVVVLALLAIYFAPTIVAVNRKVPNTGSIAVINAFLGWTLIGWVVALAMAVRTVSHAGSTPAVTISEVRKVPPEPTASQGLFSDVERLHGLHTRGVLTDGEFASAKARLIEGP